MCGICGIYDPSGVQAAHVRDMTRAIAHRGPDDEGIYVHGPVGLGYRRLSIIDLDSGWQPISNEDETVWVVFNGEIYNYRRLRQELEQRGHVFKTHSDTEVIVHLYEEFGEQCVEHLQGMFAFAIWDVRRHQLVLARDRLGQKPLFYAQIGDRLLFGSEVKAILAALDTARKIDIESLYHYLSLRFVPDSRTMLRDIKKLPPAHILVWRDMTASLSRYWTLSFRDKQMRSEDEYLGLLEQQLAQSVESHLVSDVPVGAFLSGGMDSSAIVAQMSRLDSPKFKTFSVGVREQDFNELPYARLVAERYGTDHVEHIAESKLIHMLPKIIWHLDEPSDPIAACMFQAAKLASQHVKVVLGGDGGDELFAGFDRYRGVGLVDYYAAVPSLIRTKIIGTMIQNMPESFAYKSVSQKARWVQHLSSFEDAGRRYAEATLFFRFTNRDKQALFDDSLWRNLGSLDSADVIVKHFNQANADDPIDRMLYTDFMTRLPEHSLMLTDRMTMAHSLEARSPLLDHTLVELLASFPSNMKIRGKTLKYALRKLTADWFPDVIAKRPKQGFMFPIAYWFRNELHEPIKHILLDSSFVHEGVFKRQSVLQLLEEHRQQKIDHHVRIWMLLNLEIWHRLYIGQQPVGEVEAWLLDAFERTAVTA